MAKKRKAKASAEVIPVETEYFESSEEEEAPVPQRLVAFAIFFFIALVLVTGYFQMHPKERFPDQWEEYNQIPKQERIDYVDQP